LQIILAYSTTRSFSASFQTWWLWRINPFNRSGSSSCHQTKRNKLDSIISKDWLMNLSQRFSAKAALLINSES
jgi:hypothetical protein